MLYYGEGVTKSTGSSRRRPNNRTRRTSASLNAEVLTLALRTVSTEERTMFERWYVKGETAEYIAESRGTTVKESRATLARVLATYSYFRSLVSEKNRNNAMRVSALPAVVSAVDLER